MKWIISKMILIVLKTNRLSNENLDKVTENKEKKVKVSRNYRRLLVQPLFKKRPLGNIFESQSTKTIIITLRSLLHEYIMNLSQERWIFKQTWYSICYAPQ